MTVHNPVSSVPNISVKNQADLINKVTFRIYKYIAFVFFVNNISTTVIVII